MSVTTTKTKNNLTFEQAVERAGLNFRDKWEPAWRGNQIGKKRRAGFAKSYFLGMDNGRSQVSYFRNWGQPYVAADILDRDFYKIVEELLEVGFGYRLDDDAPVTEEEKKAVEKAISDPDWLSDYLYDCFDFNTYVREHRAFMLENKRKFAIACRAMIASDTRTCDTPGKVTDFEVGDFRGYHVNFDPRQENIHRKLAETLTKENLPYSKQITDEVYQLMISWWLTGVYMRLT